jgi:DNA-binding IclR family transcriptional regulator
VADVGKLLGVNRSSAHRLLRELEENGYVVRDDATRQYVLARSGPGLLSRRGLGAGDGAALDREWHEELRRSLQGIRDEVGEATMFAVPAQDRMLYAEFFPTDHPIGVQESIGSTRPIHASAVGKAYLSALPRSELDVLLGRLSYEGGSARAARGPFQLRDMLNISRDQGYAVDRDETFLGLSCVATPVFVQETILVGAAGITGPTERFSPERVKSLGDIVLSKVRGL